MSMQNSSAAFVDLQFGTIKFVKGGSSVFAVVNVEVSIEDTSKSFETGTKIELDVKFPVRPDEQTIVEVAECARQQIIDKLRDALGIMEAKSAEFILYGSDADDLL